MTSSYSASIGVAAGDRAGAVLAAVGADARFYPDGGGSASTRVSAGAEGEDGGGGARPGVVRIDIDAGQLPHLRAGINSALRLVQASYESIGAASASDSPAPGAPAGAAAAEPRRGNRGSRGAQQRRQRRRETTTTPRRRSRQ